MRKTQLRAVLAVCLATPLGACSSFLGIHFTHHTRKAEPALAAAPTGLPESRAAVQASATDTGRSQLADGQVGLAVESFQRALAGGEPIAAAANGMGVAYARLGRFDLAQRFFEQAIATEPSDARYADNLARLLRSPLFALRHDRDIAERELRKAPTPVAPALAQAASRPATGNLQRVSRAEVRITTYPQPQERRQAGMAMVGTGFQPLIRISIAGRDQPAARNFVRVVMPEAKASAPQNAAPKITVVAANSMPARIAESRSTTQK